MNGVNLDLLRATIRHADRYAHHKVEHTANLRAARRQRWLDRIVRLCAWFAHRPAPAPQACNEQAR